MTRENAQALQDTGHKGDGVKSCLGKRILCNILSIFYVLIKYMMDKKLNSEDYIFNIHILTNIRTK